MLRRKNYQAQELAIRQLRCDVEHRVHGLPIIEVLRNLPDDTLVNIHFQKQLEQPYRRVIVKDAKTSLSHHEKACFVTRVSHDLDFCHDPKRPVAILEIPLY